MEIVFKWIGKKVDSALNRLGYFRVKLPAKFGSTRFKFTDRDVLLSVVHKVLRENLGSKSPVITEQIAEIATKVVTEVSGLQDLSISDQIKQYHHDILAHRQIIYVIGCGVATYWELSVKELAEKLNVKVFEEVTSANKKSPGLRALEPIIVDIKSAAPKLEAWITKRKNLRDALIHSNFHQLKTHIQEGKRRSVRDKLKGVVWQLRLSDQSIQKMSEMRDMAEIKRAGLFGWFLEVASSEVLEQTIIELKDGIEDLQTLVSFHAMCFDERKGLFEKMFIRGERLTDANVGLFSQEESAERIKKMFARLNRMIKK